MSFSNLLAKSVSKPNFYHLFISHHNRDIIDVEHICSEFRKFNLRIWFNENKKFNSIQFDKSLEAFRMAYFFVCFYSENYFKSSRCRADIQTAREQKMKILVILLNRVSQEDQEEYDKMNKRVLWEFKLYEQPDMMTNLNGPEFREVVEHIKQLIKEHENELNESEKL